MLKKAMSTITTRYQRMQQILSEKLNPTLLEIKDQSHKHAHHIEVKNNNAMSGGETHFDVTIVSEVFEGKKLIERHRMVNELLKDEFNSGLHALSIKAKTNKEFNK
ncbi:hypothetical protein ABK040_011819 [Willaertia magna]